MSTELEFKKFPKIPRLYRDIQITEKIDGTNAGIQIRKVPSGELVEGHGVVAEGHTWEVLVQSRNRVIVPSDDNYGFATWVYDNLEALCNTLGEGTFFGEWYGKGIQRTYGLDHRRFSLFDTRLGYVVDRALHLGVAPVGLEVVPLLYSGEFDTGEIEYQLAVLRDWGSRAVSSFDKPEGVVVRHSVTGHNYKALIENDHLPKGSI